jgi:single-strand DNA-binding protein
MAGINKVILVGNLGKDPEVRFFDNDKKKASFSLATSETYNNKEGEKITRTEWHNVVLWGRLAEIAEAYLRKGRQVYIEGKISSRSYEDKEGNKRYVTEINGQQMQLLGRQSHEGEANDTTPNSNTQKPKAAPVVDDLPF